MKILLVGDGAREHALAKEIAKSAELYSVMRYNNPGIHELSTESFISDFSSVEAIGSWALRKEIDIALVSSETAMAKGLADVFESAGIRLASPSSEASLIGENTQYAYRLMENSGVLTPEYEICHNKSEIEKALKKLGRLILKPAIKTEFGGAKFIDEDFKTKKDLVQRSLELIKRHESVILEKFIDGETFSIQAFCDGKTLAGMPPVKACKRLRASRGPLTPGMGAYSCKTLPFIKKKDYSDARAALKKMLIHMKKRGMEFRGCMRASFIAGKTGITMVGLDASFGTLESICTFPLLNVQFSEILSSVATGTLAPVDFKNLCSVAKFVTYDTYPSAIRKPRKIKVHEKKVWNQGAFAYYDSVIRKPEGFYLKTGRGIAMLAADSELARAEDRAEKAVHAVEGNLVHRPDIASEENVRKAKKHMALLRAL